MLLPFRLAPLTFTLIAIFFFACEDGGEREEAAGSTAGTPVTPQLIINGADIDGERLSTPLYHEASERSQSQLTLSVGGVDRTQEATWSSSDELILDVHLNENVAKISAVSAGQAQLVVSYEDRTLSLTVEVIEPTSLVFMDPPSPLQRGDRLTLVPQIRWSDDRLEEISTDIASSLSWQSTTQTAEVNELGEVNIVYSGQVEIIAAAVTTLGQEITGVWLTEIPCVYPDPPAGMNFDTSLALGSVIPPLSWANAHSAMDGSINELSLSEIYCSPDYDWVTTIHLIMSAGWCTACPQVLSEIANLSDDLFDAGGLLIYVEVEDDMYAPADSSYAYIHLSRLLGPTQGYFVGDLDTQPLPQFFANSPSLLDFPDAYIVRRRDMKLITSMSKHPDRSQLPFIEIAERPEDDWSSLRPQPFESVCEEGEDEPSEPNDDPMTATLLTPGTYSGGICTNAPDFYLIEEQGSWSVTLEFDHRQANLDLALFELSDDALGLPIAESSSMLNSEEMSGTGYALLRVSSSDEASTTYQLTLEIR